MLSKLGLAALLHSLRYLAGAGVGSGCGARFCPYARCDILAARSPFRDRACQQGRLRALGRQALPGSPGGCCGPDLRRLHGSVLERA